MTDQDPSPIRLPVGFIDALSGAESIEAVLTVSAQWLTRLFDASRASIAFVRDKQTVARTHRADAVIDPDFDPGGKPGCPICDTVARSGVPVFLDAFDMAAPGAGGLNLLLASGIRSMLVVPMQSGARTLGTLSLGARHPGGFDAQACRDLIAIGKWIAAQVRLMSELRLAALRAETDALTGLANRDRLIRVLDGPGALHLPGADGRVIGVLQIDLDHFKQVNDRLGHAVGDAVLTHAAAAMRAVTSNHDLVARTGGDEFIVVTRTDPDGQQIDSLAQALVAAISRPVRIGEVAARVGASIGTAMANAADRTADRLIGNADIALYEVKRNGRGGVCAFTGDMRARNEARRQLLEDLRTAVEERQFLPYFQPHVALQTGRFSSFEMLARWAHPTRGMLDPDAFLELAVEAGLADQIDGIVRAKGLSALRNLRARGWRAPRMSFNASARTLCDPDLVGDLMWEVLGKGLSPADLAIEIREAHLIDDAGGIAARNIASLAEAGFAVELDDFGTGNAAISNLAHLAISGIKLDRRLIAALPDPGHESILRAIFGLTADLGLSVVAKGVETPAQFAALRSMGCNMAQGYGISEPLPLEGLVAFMDGYGRAPVALATGTGEAPIARSQRPW